MKLETRRAVEDLISATKSIRDEVNDMANKIASEGDLEAIALARGWRKLIERCDRAMADAVVGLCNESAENGGEDAVSDL